MSDFLRRICQTPGLEVSDDIALFLPRELFMDYGYNCFNLIELAIEQDLDAECKEKLYVVIERLPRFCDGVPKEFVEWCMKQYQQCEHFSRALEACINACLHHESTWSYDKSDSAKISLCQMVLSGGKKHDKFMMQSARCNLNRILKRKDGVVLLESGRIEISDEKLEQLMAYERDRKTKIGFNDHGAESTRLVLARSFGFFAPRKLTDHTFETTGEFYSGHCYDTVFIKMEWSFEDGIYHFSRARWCGE